MYTPSCEIRVVLWASNSQFKKTNKLLQKKSYFIPLERYLEIYLEWEIDQCNTTTQKEAWLYNCRVPLVCCLCETFINKCKFCSFSLDPDGNYALHLDSEEEVRNRQQEQLRRDAIIYQEFERQVEKDVNPNV